jgi:aspartyl/asparaginyl-tRNA synthetase
VHPRQVTSSREIINITGLTNIHEIDEKMEGQEVMVHARIEWKRSKGKCLFMTLRQGMDKIQAIMFLFKNMTTREMLTYANK